MHRLTTVLIVLLGVLSPATGVAQTGAPATRTSRGGVENWPQFRGIRAAVAADDPRLRDRRSATENNAGAIDVPGRSWSSPVVWGNHVLVLTAINSEQPNPTLNAVGTYLARSLGGPMTGADITKPTAEHRWVLYDVDFETGKIRWERAIHATVPQQSTHQKNCIRVRDAGDRRRARLRLRRHSRTVAFGLDGKPEWSKPMPTPKMRMGWGTAASPVLHDGRLYIVNDNDERSFVAAFDARTGNELWRTEREGEGSNWSTPFVWRNELRTEIVTTGSKKVRSYDTRGALLWELAGMTSIHAVTPFASHGLLFVSSGYFPDPLRPTYAIKPGAAGDISLKGEERSNAFIAWSNPTLASAYIAWWSAIATTRWIAARDVDVRKTGRGSRRQRIAAVDRNAWRRRGPNGKIFAVSKGRTFVCGRLS